MPARIPRYYHPIVHVNAAAHEYPPPDMALEDEDELPGNVILLQLLAFGVVPRADTSEVYVRVSMYNFAEYCSGPLAVVKSGPADAPAPLELLAPPSSLSSASTSSLYVKPSSPSKASNSSSTAADESKTLTISFCVASGAGEGSADESKVGQFARYLEHGSLDIAVFDARTHMPLGNTRVPLRPLLRQSRRAVQLVADYPLADALAEPFLTGPVSSSESTQLQAGTHAAKTQHAPSLVLRIFNFGTRHGASAELGAAGGGIVGSGTPVHAVAPMISISAVMTNTAQLAATLDRKAAVLWQGIALVVSRQHELVAHLKGGAPAAASDAGGKAAVTCSAKELQEAIFFAGLPLTQHQAADVAAYLAREFGLVDALGHTGRGGVGGLIDLSRIEPAFVAMVHANRQMLKSSVDQVEELAGCLLELIAARYGSLERAWALNAEDDLMSTKEIDALYSRLGDSRPMDPAVRDDLLYCLGSRVDGNGSRTPIGEPEFNMFFDIHVRGRATKADGETPQQREENRKMLRWHRTERVREKCLLSKAADKGGRPGEVAQVDERLQLLEAARAMRERHKSQRIASLLQQSTDALQSVSVEAPYGEARYCTHVIVNPFLQPRVLEITSGHEAVSVVSDDAELGWARRCHWLHVGAANSVRDSSSSSASVSAAFELAEVATRTEKGWQLLVDKATKVTVVLKVRCIGPAQGGPRAVAGMPALSGGAGLEPWEMGGAQAQISHGRARGSVNSVMLTVVAKKHEHADEMVSRVQVRIAVLPPAVDRTLRFFSGSHEPFERHIVMAVNGVPASCPHRLPDWRRPLLKEGEGAGGAAAAGRVAVGEGAGSQLKFSAWCSDDEASVTALRREDGLQEVHVLRRGHAAGETDSFFLVIYADAFTSSVVTVFQCLVSYYTRLPLKGVVGHAAPPAAHYRLRTLCSVSSDVAALQCVGSHPDVVSSTLVSSEDGAVNLDLLFRPMTVGHLNALLYIVDPGTGAGASRGGEGAGRMVAGAIVSAVSSRPHISQRYKVRVVAGKSVCKKISYTNTYPARRIFRFRTNRPQVSLLSRSHTPSRARALFRARFFATSSCPSSSSPPPKPCPHLLPDHLSFHPPPPGSHATRPGRARRRQLGSRAGQGRYWIFEYAHLRPGNQREH